ncbi:MAG: hypothetical protein EHM23_31445 [Acidobacteria bacterium]|nr:MAG: hypothetical protein EHM23_31445 [Acidobacteriota bacterium]
MLLQNAADKPLSLWATVKSIDPCFIHTFLKKDQRYRADTTSRPGGTIAVIAGRSVGMILSEKGLHVLLMVDDQPPLVIPHRAGGARCEDVVTS